MPRSRPRRDVLTPMQQPQPQWLVAVAPWTETPPLQQPLRPLPPRAHQLRALASRAAVLVMVLVLATALASL
jgi:hypothetical protein